MIEHGYFTGKTKVISRSSAEPKAFAGDEAGDGVGDGECRQTMMDVLVETINQCAEDFDEGVQLQVHFISQLIMFLLLVYHQLVYINL